MEAGEEATAAFLAFLHHKLSSPPPSHSPSLPLVTRDERPVSCTREEGKKYNCVPASKLSLIGSVGLPASLSLIGSVFLSVCLSVYLSLALSVCLSLSVSLSLSLSLSRLSVML